MRELIIEYLMTTTLTCLYFENSAARIDNVSDEIDALQAVAVATLASAIRRHVATAKYMKKHNKGIRAGFIKPSDTRMMGDWPTR